MNCAVLTALCSLFIFQDFEFCNNLFLTILFVTGVLDASWPWATLEALLPQSVKDLKDQWSSMSNTVCLKQCKQKIEVKNFCEL